MNISAVVFDMDGVLIDTEPVWRDAVIGVLGGLGCTLTYADMAETMGVPVLDVVRHWRSLHPWRGPSDEAVATEILDAVIATVMRDGVPMPGVHSALSTVRGAGLPCAIASSSPLRLIGAVMDRLGIAGAIDAVCTADDEVAGKPHPAVFLRAAERLGCEPHRCLAIEDSPNGVRSALAAGMVCAAIPDPAHADDPVMTDAHHRLTSLDDVTAEWLGKVSQGARAHAPAQQ